MRKTHINIKRIIALIISLSLLLSTHSYAIDGNSGNHNEVKLDDSTLAVIDELFGLSISDGSQTYSASEELNLETLSMAAQGRTVIKYANKIEFVCAFEKSPSPEICYCSPEEAIIKCQEKLPMLENLFQIDDDYELSDGIIFDEDYIMFSASKRLENGIINDLQSLKMFFDMRSGCFALVNSFNLEPNALYPLVTEDEAIRFAYANTGDCFSVELCELKYVDKSLFAFADNPNNESTLAYAVSFNNGEITYIDAINGNIIGNDLVLSEQAHCYAIYESTNPAAWGYRPGTTAAKIAEFNSYRADNIQLSSSGFSALGYNVTLASTYSGSSINTDVINYIQGNSNEYAFYFNGHGSSTEMGFKLHPVFNYTQVSGNWHFVYLDGCSTAADTTWANAFHIYGYSNRAYLGWSNAVQLVYTHEFNEHFWPLMTGYNYVRYSAQLAASQVNGTGTTPIRFYGDIYYKGGAWS